MAGDYSRNPGRNSRRLRLLLDTNVIIRAFDDVEALPPRVRELLEDGAQEALVSIVSIWEIAIKHRVGKLPLDARRALAAARTTGLGLLQLDAAHLPALDGLRKPPPHADPFDHLLVAQACTRV